MRKPFEHKKLESWLDSLRVHPGDKARLRHRAPDVYPDGLSKEIAQDLTNDAVVHLDRLQYLLFADAQASLLIVLQGLDAADKDGTIRHVLTGMNPQGVRVAAFKQPTPEEQSHGFLWRAHRAAPGRGEVAIFNRSHYEDVLVVRVHDLTPEPVWRRRYDQINQFEALLAANGTKVLKFFLHISPEEQLKRFGKRLEDPDRQWKISETDYTERALWNDYTAAYEDVLSRCSTEDAPWYVIPSDRKWVRDLATSRIIAQTLSDMKLKAPPVRVDLDEIRRRFHKAQG